MNAVRVAGGSGFVLGMLLTSVSAHAADSDGDGIANPQDACKDAPETVNGYADLDGCPDQLGSVRVIVKDLEGAPVPKAKVRLGALTDFTQADGSTLFTEVMPGSRQTLRIEAATYVVKDADDVEVEEGESSQVVTLDWLPVAWHVHVRDPLAGTPVDAVVRVDGPGLVEPQRTGPDGEVVIELRPGPWKLQAYADHYLRSSMDLPVRPSAEPQSLQVDLTPTWSTWSSQAVVFPAGDATLSADAKAVLDGLAVELIAWEGIDVEVQGYTDAGSTDDALDDARADAVVARLVAQQVPADRLYATGKGAPGDGQAGAGFRVVVPDEAVSLPYRVSFAARSDVPEEAVGGPLDDLAALLRVHERVRALVVGHVAAGESPGLADQRAGAVVVRLGKRGIDATRVQALGSLDPEGSFVELLVLPPAAVKDRRVAFAAAASDVPEAGLPTIRAVAEAMKLYPTARVKVFGVGTPTDGAAAATVGLERAKKVVAALVAEGAPRGKLAPAGLSTQSGGAGFVAFELTSLRMAETLAFEAGAAITPADAAALERVRQAMLVFPSATFEARGVDAAAVAQAEAAVRWLVARGADPRRLTAVATPPDVTPNARVELVVTSPLE